MAGGQGHTSLRQQPSRNCCLAGVPRTSSASAAPPRTVRQARPGPQRRGLSLPAPPPAQPGPGGLAACWLCWSKNQEQESGTQPTEPTRLLHTYCVLQVLTHSPVSVCLCCRCFLSTYVLGIIDANKAIHSFIPFFLLPFDKYLGEKRSSWKV